jgi:peptidyl-tRNA hydrolase
MNSPDTHPHDGPTWVQPIVVSRAGTHWETIRAAAAASALAHYAHPLRPEWAPWFAGQITKNVRRADVRGMERAAAACDPHVIVHLGTATALACRPYPKGELPDAINRLQMRGTNLPVDSQAGQVAGMFTILLNADLAMSTGKSAAQAAHAVSQFVAWHMSPEQGAWWASSPTDFAVRAVSAAELATWATTAPVVIRDAGLTEIAANSLTAVAIP